jgi:hypothetical protein
MTASGREAASFWASCIVEPLILAPLWRRETMRPLCPYLPRSLHTGLKPLETVSVPAPGIEHPAEVPIPNRD